MAYVSAAAGGRDLIRSYCNMVREDTGDEPRSKKVRIIDPEATNKDQPIVSSNSGDGKNVRRSRPPPPPASFTATLPSTGLDVLLIGRTDLSRPLAESMLSVTFDRQTVFDNTAPSGFHGKKNKQSRREMASSVSRGKGDPAIEALRRHLRRSSAADATTGGSRGGGVGSFGLADAVRARHVRLVESLSDLDDGHKLGKGDKQEEQANNNSDTATKEPNDTNNTDGNGKTTDPRVDHAVIVLAPTDPFSSTRLRQAAASLHPDYAIQGRVTIVYAVGGRGDNGNDGPAKAACPDLDRLLEDAERGVASKLPSAGMTRGGSAGSKTNKMVLFASSVPVLRCNLKESRSRLAVARMILQRSKMGNRGCMGADDGLDVVVSKAEVVGGESNAVGGGGEEEGNISAGGLKSEIDGTKKGGISPLFFSSIL